MNQQELKKSAIENNIKTIQKRIQELEQSFDSVHKELSVDEEPPLQEYPQVLPREPLQAPPLVDRSFSKARSEAGDVRSNFRRPSKRKDDDDQYSVAPDNIEGRRLIEGLLREIDSLRENEKQADIRVETLTFRCEKLQTELTVKLDANNRLLMDVEEKNTQIKNLLNQINNLEAVIETNKRSLLPDYQRIKGQHDIALLEIRSLENDNTILENRIQDLSATMAKLRDEKREVDSKNRQIEIERLSLKKQIEELKATYINHENQIEDIKDKYEKVILENERLKNEILFLNQRNKIQDQDSNLPEDILADYDTNKAPKDYSGMIAKAKMDRRTNDGGEGRGMGLTLGLGSATDAVLRTEVEKRATRGLDRLGKDGGMTPNRLVNPQPERLNFDQLEMLGERMKKLNK